MEVQNRGKKKKGSRVKVSLEFTRVWRPFVFHLEPRFIKKYPYTSCSWASVVCVVEPLFSIRMLWCLLGVLPVGVGWWKVPHLRCLCLSTRLRTFQWFCWNKFLPSNMGLYFARTIVVLVPPRFVMQNRAFFYWHKLFSICPFSCQLRHQQWCVHNADSYYIVFCCNYAVLVECCIIVGPGHMTTSPVVVDNLIFHQWSFPGSQEICVAVMIKLEPDTLFGQQEFA